MKARAEIGNASVKVRKVIDAMMGVEGAIKAGGLEPLLLHLVKMRASQINGCAYCLDMHSKDLRALGESEQRIYCLDAWGESPFYTDRERAALTWTEAVTDLVGGGHVPDSVYEQAKAHFNEEELEILTLAVAAINFWNRVTIPLRAVAGSYQPAKEVGAERREAAGMR